MYVNDSEALVPEETSGRKKHAPDTQVIERAVIKARVCRNSAGRKCRR